MTQTNGVSFSLVAGAICGVYFSNSVEQKTVTLNINSTGAKNFYGGRSTWGSNVISGNSNSNYTTLYDTARYSIVVYTGSSYYGTSSIWASYYQDYQD